MWCLRFYKHHTRIVMKNKVVFIIPYFGRIPSYFHLWLKSAEKNPDFDFFIYSDLSLNIKAGSNVKQIQISFVELKSKIEKMLNKKVCLKTPYKLCDFKPLYGLLFEEEIKEYDFWGFVDVDLILGHLTTFISDQLLDSYDKLYYEGHFSLFRNCKLMNTLFMRTYPHVLDWKYAFSTNYVCHFDENGTVVWAHEVDPSCKVRFHTFWNFLDAPVDSYEISNGQTNGYALWKNGILKFYSFDGKVIKELMYIHLQKRNMYILGGEKIAKDSLEFAIARNTFYLDTEGCTEYKRPDNNIENIKKFMMEKKRARRKGIVTNVINGALRARVYRKIKKWKSR